MCDPTSLRELLDAATLHECDETVVQHVDECEACRSALERLAADASWWSDSRALLVAADGDATESSSQVLAICEGDSTSLSPPPLGGVDFLQPPSHPELLGQLGKYQIESVIGRGGMGIVLKGFDIELNRTVAIKVLAPHLASSGAARQRFSREARAAAAVVHDHVVAIHSIETDGELPYIVMPYVGGESLQSYVARFGPLELKDIVRIAMQVASGLAAAHEQGLVHRDIKPANILLENGFGRVLITDFGLARAADDASITRSGLVAGTPHYMSPEQANGHSVDHRSDLFSLGGVLFFMATGRAPFRGEGAMAVLNAICHKDLKSPCEINASLPPEIDLLVEQLLKKDPAERFGSASELRKLLADYLAHLQNPSKNQLPAKLSMVRQSSRTLVVLLSMGIASLLAISALGMWPEGSDTAPPAGRPHQFAQPQTVAGNQVVVEDFDGETAALKRTMADVKREWDSDGTPSRHFDDWNQAVRQLNQRIFQVEQEWSGSLTD